jgi:hypothetical protein
MKRDAQISTNRITEMMDVPFRSVSQDMVGIYLSVFVMKHSLHAFKGRKFAPKSVVNGGGKFTTDGKAR